MNKAWRHQRTKKVPSSNFILNAYVLPQKELTFRTDLFLHMADDIQQCPKDHGKKYEGKALDWM